MLLYVFLRSLHLVYTFISLSLFLFLIASSSCFRSIDRLTLLLRSRGDDWTPQGALYTQPKTINQLFIYGNEEDTPRVESPRFMGHDLPVACESG